MRAIEQEPFPSRGGAAFYAVTAEQAGWMFRHLTKSAYAILIYLRASDPFGKRVNAVIDPAEIAQVIGCSERGVRRSLQDLAELELIELKQLSTRQAISTYSEKARSEIVPFPRSGAEPEKAISVSSKKVLDRDDKRMTERETESQSRRNQEPELNPNKAFKISKTNKTKQIQDLERERETALSEILEMLEIDLKGFEEWLIRRSQELPRPPALIDEWVYKQMQKVTNQKGYKKYSQGRSKPELIQSSGPLLENSNCEQLLEILAPRPPESIPVGEEPHLERLRGMWSGGGFSQTLVRKAIREHPEWGIVLGPDGPEKDVEF
jgi:hypothetical protein